MVSPEEMQAAKALCREAEAFGFELANTCGEAIFAQCQQKFGDDKPLKKMLVFSAVASEVLAAEMQRRTRASEESCSDPVFSFFMETARQKSRHFVEENARWSEPRG